MTRLTIQAKHPARSVCYDFETYHDCPEGALRIMESKLADYGIVVDRGAWGKITGSDGRATFNLRPEEGAGIVCECCAAKADRAEFNVMLVFAWYEVSAGRFEITSYIS